MSLPDLAAVLWRQRELIERLCYRLECEQLLLTAGRMNRIAFAISEVESVVEDLLVLEVQRGEAADRAAAELDLPAGSGLADLAAAAEPPWTGVLLEHRAALISLTAQLHGLADANKSMISSGMALVEASMSSLGSLSPHQPVGYDATGHADPVAGRLPAVIDRVL